MSFEKTNIDPSFTYLDSSIRVNLKYFTTDNFLGEVVPSYLRNVGIMKKEAAEALLKAQKMFNKDGYEIVVYDAYRPQTAVDRFSDWMRNEPDNMKRKKYHYPYIKNKSDMAGIYIAEKSGHSHGYTVDMSIIEKGKNLLTYAIYTPRTFGGKVYPFLDDGTVDCGTSFDLMDPMSHPNNTLVTKEQKAMRDYISSVMDKAGFDVLDTEWWHFTLRGQNETTFYDFPIE